MMFTRSAVFAVFTWIAMLAAATALGAGIPAPRAYAPDVPPPISRTGPETLVVHIETKMTPITLTTGVT